MPGLIESAQPTTASPSGAPKGKMDPKLATIKAGIEEKLPAEMKEPVGRIVTAGMRLLYDPSTQGMVDEVYDDIEQNGFKPEEIAMGVANLMVMILQASKGKADVLGLYPGGVIILMYVLDDLHKEKGLEITEDLIGKAVVAFKDQYLKMKVRPEGAQPPSGAEGAPPGAEQAPPVAEPAPGGMVQGA